MVPDDYLKLLFFMFVKLFEPISLTSLAMVVMKAGGRAVAMRERAWRDERAESAGGLRGRPMVTLWRERERTYFFHDKSTWKAKI